MLPTVSERIVTKKKRALVYVCVESAILTFMGAQPNMPATAQGCTRADMMIVRDHAFFCLSRNVCINRKDVVNEQV